MSPTTLTLGTTAMTDQDYFENVRTATVAAGASPMQTVGKQLEEATKGLTMLQDRLDRLVGAIGGTIEASKAPTEPSTIIDALRDINGRINRCLHTIDTLGVS